MPAKSDPTFASDLTGRGFVGLFLGLNAQASCCRAFSPSDRAVGCRAFSPSDRADGPTARSTGVQPCVRRCRKTRPERSPARFDPTFASDLSGRGFVGLFLGLKAQATCCRAFSPSDRADRAGSALPYSNIVQAFAPLRLCASPPLEIGSHRIRIEKSRAKPQSRKATSHSIMVGRIRLTRHSALGTDH